MSQKHKGKKGKKLPIRGFFNRVSIVSRDCIIFALLRSVIAKRKSIVSCSPPNSCAFSILPVLLTLIHSFIILYCPAFTFSTFCRLSLNMWFPYLGNDKRASGNNT